MKAKKEKLILISAGALWLSMIGAGTSVLWNYSGTPGAAAEAPSSWPAGSSLGRAPDRATLVMTAHPHCPCTRASVGELARLMTQARGRVSAYVLFVKPPGFAEGWEKTDLWSSAASIPGVSVVRDDGGAEARLFRAATSGQAVLYGADGGLLFSGGITAARGHAGDNAGRTAVVSLLTDGAGRRETSVFGCPLFAEDDECRAGKEGAHAAEQHRR